jgi:hypothetical protein
LTTYDTLLVEQRQHVVYVTLNRPTALNALSTPLRRDLKQCFRTYKPILMCELWSSPVPAGPFAQEPISKSGASRPR